MIMHMGFTGTRYGMTADQRTAFIGVLARLMPKHFHHGDCVGADDQAATIANDAATVICHPPVDEAHRAYNRFSKETRPPKTHFARNRDIVDESDLLVACPVTMTEATHGGTWYTVNYARKKKKPLIIVWPDGTLTHEGGTHV